MKVKFHTYQFTHNIFIIISRALSILKHRAMFLELSTNKVLVTIFLIVFYIYPLALAAGPLLKFNIKFSH